MKPSRGCVDTKWPRDLVMSDDDTGVDREKTTRQAFWMTVRTERFREVCLPEPVVPRKAPCATVRAGRFLRVPVHVHDPVVTRQAPCTTVRAARFRNVPVAPQAPGTTVRTARRREVRFPDPVVTHIDEFEVMSPMLAWHRDRQERFPDPVVTQIDESEVETSMLAGDFDDSACIDHLRQYKTVRFSHHGSIDLYVEWLHDISSRGFLATFEMPIDESVGAFRHQVEEFTGRSPDVELLLFTRAIRKLRDSEPLSSLAPAGLRHATIFAQRRHYVRFRRDIPLGGWLAEESESDIEVAFGDSDMLEPVVVTVRWMSGTFLCELSLSPKQKVGALRRQVQRKAGFARVGRRLGKRLVRLIHGVEELSRDDMPVADIAVDRSLELVVVACQGMRFGQGEVTFKEEFESGGPMKRTRHAFLEEVWPAYVPPPSDAEESADEAQ